MCECRNELHALLLLIEIGSLSKSRAVSKHGPREDPSGGEDVQVEERAGQSGREDGLL